MPAGLGLAAVGIGLAVRGDALWFAIAGLAAVGYAVFAGRRLVRVGDRVQIRGVIAKDEIGVDAAFGDRTTGGGRSPSLEIYATDGERMVVLWSLTPTRMGIGPEMCAQLRTALCTTANPDAQSLVDETRAPMAAAEAVVRAWYTSGGSRRTAITIGVVLAAYLVVMSIVIAMS